MELDLENLKTSNHDYVKIWIRPWSSINIVNSTTSEPNGKIKSKILGGLLNIYASWKTKLDTIGQPYYLKIWLYEEQFRKSEVVCAIDSRIDFYNNTFHFPDSKKEFPLENYPKLKNILDKFTWTYGWDEDSFSNLDLEENPEYYEKRLKKPHRVSTVNEKIELIYDDNTRKVFEKVYCFKIGDVWVGEA